MVSFISDRYMQCYIILFLFISILGCKKESDDKKDFLNLLTLGLYARSCAGQNAFPSSGTVGSLTRLQIRPSQTSSGISNYDQPHYVFPPQSGVTNKNILSVFYPGTGSSPCEVNTFLQHGATRGYHVVGLSYPNGEAVNTVCNQGAAKSETNCFENLRKEVLTGVDLSPYVSVDISNSIEGRLLSLIQYLIRVRPSEGWDQFLTGNQINWSLVYVGGHSQGSGHAALQGKNRTLGRVSIYSGVSDYSLQNSTLPSWMGGTQNTPGTSYYGLIHENDSIANFSGNSNQVTNAWLNQFSMTGPITNTNVGFPFNNSHSLVTSVCNGMGAFGLHICPMTSGFQSIWNYISFP
ncbi:BPSS1187 family protein [Leptospira bandrabouensis]|nr:hypothetical protein [Leptospira bandrabouensis]MCG6152000.1 hypothetical protein [Leptospira bandrabouensis]